MNTPRSKSWSPYIVGAGIGVLSWFTFVTVDKPLGITTAFERTAALATSAVTGGGAQGLAWYGNPDNQLKIGWEWTLVVGVFLGSLTSAWLSGDRTRLKVPALWAWRFGAQPRFRLAMAVAGGGLMMLGARIARGCTSGHGISGSLQLAAASWLFVIVLFAVAIATAFLLYGRQGGRHV